MSRHQSVILILGVMTIIVITAAAAIRTQDQNNQAGKEEQQLDFKNQFPIADYEATLPDKPEERVKRQRKNQKYDKSLISVGEKDEVVASARDWASSLSGTPVDDSDAIVIGEITDAKSFLSNDKTGVYSEFSLKISDVLKNDSRTPLALRNTITVERPGGRVKFPSGHISTYFTAGQGMPRVGRLYVLFLRHEDQEANFLILTGYELRAGRVFLLDNPGAGHPIQANKDKDATAFLNNILSTIASSNTTPK